MDGSEPGSGLIWVELLIDAVPWILVWLARPDLMMADWIACWLTAMSVLAAVFS